jgi:hemerythrin superfamily protein
MTTIRSFMTDDHRRCDDLFAEAEQAIGKGNLEAAQAAFGHFRTAVLAHFASEEKTLFPSFEAKTGMSMGPTQVMRMEHEQMRSPCSMTPPMRLKAGDYRGVSRPLPIPC